MSTWDALTAEERYQTLKMMEDYGGGFCQAIVRAMQIADQGNLRLLVTTFDHLIEKYQPKNWRTACANEQS